MYGSDYDSKDSVLLRKLKQIVLENLQNENFGVSQLSETIGMSRSNLFRKLKLLTGKSISCFIREIRLENSLELLQIGDLTASEVAYQVGFNSPSYFHKCFLKFYGFHPSEAKKGVYEKGINFNEELKAGFLSSKRIIIAVMILITVFLLSYFMISPFPKVVVENEQIPDKFLAVLPFQNLSDDKANQYFVDGLVYDLIGRLSKVEGVSVISQTSSESYRDRGSKTIPDIAEELGVSYIVEGSVQRDQGRIRISVQLINAKKDEQLWSGIYDRKLEDIFSTQADIALMIFSEMQILLTPEQTEYLSSFGTTSLKALENYQMGRYHYDKMTEESMDKSRAYFEAAIKEDSNYARAYVGLADALYFPLNFKSRIGLVQKKEILVNKALQLDNNLGEAYGSLAECYERECNWEAAMGAYKKAINLEPNNSRILRPYALYLYATGQKKLSREVIDKSLVYDPNSFLNRHYSAFIYCNDGKYEKALGEIKICEELNRDQPWTLLGAFFINNKLGRTDKALGYFKRYASVVYGDGFSEKLDSINKSEGYRGLITWQLSKTDERETDNEFAEHKAELYAELGNEEKAMKMLELAYDAGILSNWFMHRPFYKKYCNNPRFKALVKNRNLYNYYYDENDIYVF